MKKSFVVEVNKERGLLNIIKSNLWENKDILLQLINRYNYYNDIQGLENDIPIKDIKKVTNDFILSLKDKNNFKKFTVRLKENCTKKVTNKELLEIEGLEENFSNWDNIHNYILENIIPIVEKM